MTPVYFVMMASDYWQKILSRRPQTPFEFMSVIYDLKPDIDELDVVRWQRSTRDWTTDVFEFIWFQLKICKGETKWTPHTEALWPKIKSVLDAEHLDTLLKQMSL
jgi:hypothetical protein